MKNKIENIMIIIFSLVLITGCNSENTTNYEIFDESIDRYSQLIDYEEALEIFAEGEVAEVLDIYTGITYNIRRIEGGFTTIGDVETLTIEDTNKLLETTGGTWSIVRRPIIITIGEYKIAASISPFEHSGSEEYDYLEVIDNRTGSTGSGVNLDYIRDNGLIGVVDIYFYNSLTPGLNRVDERHQEMVLEAYDYEG